MAKAIFSQLSPKDCNINFIALLSDGPHNSQLYYLERIPKILEYIHFARTSSVTLWKDYTSYFSTRILSYPCIRANNIFLNFLIAQAHSSVERAGLLGGVQFRSLPIDEEYKLRGSTVAEAIDEDRKKGLIPFYVSFLHKRIHVSLNFVRAVLLLHFGVEFRRKAENPN